MSKTASLNIEKANIFIPISIKPKENSEVEISDNLFIPEWHKQIVRERIENARKNPSTMLDWEKVKDTF